MGQPHQEIGRDLFGIAKQLLLILAVLSGSHRKQADPPGSAKLKVAVATDAGPFPHVTTGHSPSFKTVWIAALSPQRLHRHTTVFVPHV